MASAGDERIMKQFGISAEQMGVVYSAFLIIYTIFMIPGGLFIDRFGPRVALTVMGVGTAMFCAFTGMVGWGFIAALRAHRNVGLVTNGHRAEVLHPDRGTKQFGKLMQYLAEVHAGGTRTLQETLVETLPRLRRGASPVRPPD